MNMTQRFKSLSQATVFASKQQASSGRAETESQVESIVLIPTEEELVSEFLVLKDNYLDNKCCLVEKYCDQMT